MSVSELQASAHHNSDFVGVPSMRTLIFLDSFRVESRNSSLVRLWPEDESKPTVETVTLHSASVAGWFQKKLEARLRTSLVTSRSDAGGIEMKRCRESRRPQTSPLQALGLCIVAFRNFALILFGSLRPGTLALGLNDINKYFIIALT